MKSDFLERFLVHFLCFSVGRLKHAWSGLLSNLFIGGFVAALLVQSVPLLHIPCLQL